MNLKSKLLSLFLSVAMIVSIFSIDAYASSFNPVVDTITSATDTRISTMLSEIDNQSFTSPSASTVQNYISYFIFDSKYAAIGGSNFPYTNEAGYTSTVTDGTYTISGINGSGCFAYAKFVMNVVYGKTGAVLSEGESAGKMTAAGVEDFLRTNAQAGELLRVGNYHSVVFIACVPGGFYYLDTWDNYKVRLHFATFASWANACNTVGTATTLYNANTNLNDTSKQDTDSDEEESELRINPGSYPSGQVVRGSFSLTGTVTSNYVINSFTGTIYNADGTVNQTKTITPNSKSLSISSSAVNSALSFGKLVEGQSYFLGYTAEDASGKTVVWTSDVFTVIASSADVSTLTIDPGEYPKGTIKPAAYTLTGTVTSNYNITSVSGFIINENGDVLQSASKQNLNTKTFQIENSGIDNALKFGELEDGSYYLMYAATDASDSSVTWTSALFTISVSGGELTPDATPSQPSAVPSTLMIQPTSYPTGNIAQNAYPLRGTISSNYDITAVEATICTAYDGVIQTVTDTPNTTSYSFSSKINTSMKFASLDPGYYYLRIVATDSSGNTVEWRSDIFAVSSCTLFTDVQNASSWYYQPVYYLAAMGIIAGIDNWDGTVSFQPSQNLTRAQAVTLLYSTECVLNGTPNVTSVTTPFQDLTANWYQTAIKWAYSRGIVAGTSTTEFSPDSYVTREQLAVMIYRYANGTNFAENYLNNYQDVSQVSTWAVEGMNWCVGNGIISSTDSSGYSLEPKSNAGRGQAAVMIYRTFFY